MRDHRLEIYVQPDGKTMACWICSPKFGSAGEFFTKPLQTMVLNDGVNRVRCGIYNQIVSVDVVKHCARIALS